MATLLHVTGYVLSEMFDDYDGSLFTSDIETIAVEAAIADLPDLLQHPAAIGDWPVAAVGWVEAWDGRKKVEWPGTYTSQIWRNKLGNVEIITSLYWV